MRVRARTRVHAGWWAGCVVAKTVVARTVRYGRYMPPTRYTRTHQDTNHPQGEAKLVGVIGSFTFALVTTARRRERWLLRR